MSPFIEFHIVTLYRDSKLRQEAEAASEAPAEDSSFVEDDWGSDGGEDVWADDGGDWKRKKRSSVEEAPSERWTRETHEVNIMENLTAAQVERGASILQRCVNFQEPTLDLPSADLRTMDHDANTYEKVVLNYHSSSNIPCSHRVALWTASATGVCSETGM